MKYIIQYESAHYCGYELFCVTEAFNEDHALDKADHFMYDSMADYVGSPDEDDEDDEEDDPGTYVVTLVEPLDHNSEFWEFYQDPTQAEFYPEVS